MTAAIKKFLQAGIKFLEKVPVVSLIKAGVFVGASAFTVWVMVRRTKKIRHEDEESTLFRSPVDEILSHNYVADPDAFDDLDLEAQRICRKLCKGWKRPKKRKKAKSTKKKSDEYVRVVSLFDDKDFDKEVADPPPPPPLYRDTLDMFMDMDKKKKWRDCKPNPEKIARAKANAKKKRKAANDKMKRIRDEWAAAGVNPKDFREKLDQIARELHLPVDDTDDGISDTFRAANPALF